MATIYKREDSPYFQYRFQHNGKTYRGTTGTNNKAQAKLFLDQKIAEIKGSKDYLNLFDRILEQIQKLSSEKQIQIKRKLAFELLKNTNSILSLNEAITLYIEKKDYSSQEQLNRDKSFYRKLIKWLHENHSDIKYVNQITFQIADKYMNYLWNQNVSPNTFNKHLGFFKRMFDLIKLEAGLSDNVWREINYRKLITNHKKALTLEQFKAILDFADDEIRTLLILGFYTGLRLGDCCNLKREDIDFKNKTINLISSKTKIPISIALHDTLYETLRESWDITEKYILPDLHTQYEENSVTITDHIKKLFIKANIQTSNKKDRGQRRSVDYGFNSIRYTTVNMLHSQGVSQPIVEKLVGYNTKSVCDTYKHTTSGEIHDAISTLPDLDNI